MFKKKSSHVDMDYGLLHDNPSANNGRSMGMQSLNSHNDNTKIQFNPVVDPEDWDLIMVIPNPNHNEDESKPKPSHQMSPEEIAERLHIAGLKTYFFYAVDKEEIFIKIKAPISRLEEHAEETEFIMRLDEHYLKRSVDDQKHPIADDPEITSLHPYEYIYGKFVRDKKMFALAPGRQDPFTHIIRVKLTLSIIESNSEGCCCLDIDKLYEDQSIIAVYPLHNVEWQHDLARNWFSWRVNPWDQPVDEIKEYFGEKVGLYFEYIGHYTTWLLPLAIAGLVVSFDIAVEAGLYKSFSKAIVTGYTIPFYCVFVSYWAQFMIEFWKRKQNTKAMEWGMTEFEEQESDRTEFQGEMIRSIVNGKKIKYFSAFNRLKRVLYSYLVISALMMLVVGTVTVIFYVQYYMTVVSNDPSANAYGNTVSSVASAVQIQVLGSFYNDLAEKLTNQENHRTDTEYDDALIAKLFAFTFVNSYASLYFVAFIKHGLEPCAGPCMGELAYQLTVIFGTKIFVDKIQKYVTFTLTKWWRHRQELKLLDEAIARGERQAELSQAEDELNFDVYDPATGTLQDFSELMIQYGYVTLFVSACPVAPMLAYISNWLEIRSDGWRLLYMTRRTLPTGAEDIGTWLSILQLTSCIAVVTNAGIVCYTMHLIKISGVGTVWIFIGLQYFIFISMAIFAYLVDDCPEEVTIQLQRQEHLVELAYMTDEEKGALSKTESNAEHAMEHMQPPGGVTALQIHANDDKAKAQD